MKVTILQHAEIFVAFAGSGGLPAVTMSMRAGVFIERDGILNGIRLNGHQPAGPRSLEELQICEETVPLLQRLKGAGLVVVATTNELGLSDGSVCRSELDLMHRRLRSVFPVDDILFCPHSESDRCPCRKPRPGLLIEAAFKFHLKLDHCFIISDRWQDAHAARLAGCTSVLFESPWIGDSHRDFLVADLSEAVEKVLALQSARVGLVGAFQK